MSKINNLTGISPETAAQLCNVDRQIGALSSIIIAILLSIVTLCRSKNIILGNPTDEDLRIVTKLPRLSISIILLASVFFLFESYKTYRSTETEDNCNYLTANILAFTATYIRFTTIFNSSGFDEGETEF